jgi:prolipoprotein diacylglyceryl transferase
VLASIPSPSNGTIDIGPLPLHAYGLLLAIGVVVGAKIAETRWVRRGGDAKTFGELVVWIVVVAVICSRIYHLFTGYDWERDGIVGTVKIWEGGLGSWGWLAGGALTIVVLGRVKHLDALVLLDCIAPGVAAAQAIGRWGNWFNQELFGRPTDLPWALEIDPQNRPDGYIQDATFHPTFLYESIYVLLLFCFLIWAERRFRFRKGQTFAAYLALYTFGRFFFELLRIDEGPQILLGLRINAWVSALVCVSSAAWFVWLRGRGRPYDTPAQPARADSPHVIPPPAIP